MNCSVDNTCSSKAYRPMVDVWETNTDFHIAADVPGATPENTTVEIKSGELFLKVEVADRIPEGSKVSLREYGVGNYERVFRFDPTLVGEDVKATISNGVIHLQWAKAVPESVRKIPVQAN